MMKISAECESTNSVKPKPERKRFSIKTNDTLTLNNPVRSLFVIIYTVEPCYFELSAETRIVRNSGSLKQPIANH